MSRVAVYKTKAIPTLNTCLAHDDRPGIRVYQPSINKDVLGDLSQGQFPERRLTNAEGTKEEPAHNV